MPGVVTVGHGQQAGLDLREAIIGDTLMHRHAVCGVLDGGHRVASGTVTCPDGFELFSGDAVRQCTHGIGQRRYIPDCPVQVLTRCLPDCHREHAWCWTVAKAREHAPGLHFVHRLVQLERSSRHLHRMQPHEGHAQMKEMQKLLIH
ncbi:hypothetical protein D3C85_1400340 [compost metagenome]